MVKKEVFQFLSADKTSKIHGVRWTPENGEIHAVLQITHGMVEYVERYTEFAEFLCEKGYAVVGHDHIGHGESVSGPEEWGIMKGEHPSDTMVADMYQDYQLHKEMFPQVPYFMLGHSMGSYMLRKFLSVHSKDLDGLSGAIIMGTGTEADGTIKAGLTVLRIMAAFKSWNYRSPMVANMMYGKPYKQYDVTGADVKNSWLSKNEESVTKYYKDPKCTYLFSLGAFKGLVESTAYDNDQSHINEIPKKLPILFTSGADDPVGNMGKGVQEAFDKFKSAGMIDVSMKLYPGDRHEILNELDRETVYQDLYQWMEKKQTKGVVTK